MVAAPTEGVQILDANGNPMQKKKALIGSGIGQTPYDAANMTDQRMAGWQPYLASADGELNMYRDRIVSRVRDVVRNDGWGSGIISRILDNAVGANFRPVPKPDYRALAAATGNKGFDAKWASDFSRALGGHWRTFANDPGKYCDAARKSTVPQLLRLAFRHKLIDGDALCLVLWLPERKGFGKARYSTAFQMVDPDRLSNPQNMWNQKTVRGGVEIDHNGAAIGYHIRRAHVGDWYNAGDSVIWDYVPRETEWGRPVVIHDFDVDRAQQHRGGAGILTPVLQRLKMLIQFEGAELDAAIINAIFGAYIESPFDPELVQSALTSEGDLSAYQTERSEFHSGKGAINLAGARVPILFPGEKINAVEAARPNAAFAEFEGAMLRNVASAAGLSYEQVSCDWSQSNYSSARGALMEAWKTLERRRDDFVHGFCANMFSAFVEESMALDDLPMPDGVIPEFQEFRAAFSNAMWIGPGRGWIDPVKERQGSVMGMEAALSTLEQEAAEASGMDWEEVLDQREIEIQAFKDRGIDLPSWGVKTDEAVVSDRIG